jgi:hypothetical protein
MSEVRGGAAVAVMVLALALMAGCAADEGKGRRSAQPGRPLADGLTVPAGTWLAGGVFWKPGYVSQAESEAPPSSSTSASTVSSPSSQPDGTTSSPSSPATSEPLSGGVQEPDTWHAYLVIDGDPFEAYDELAAQLRDRVGAPVAGTAQSCIWRTAEWEERPPVVLEPAPSGIEGLECSAFASAEPDGSGGQEYRLELAWWERETPMLTVSRSDPMAASNPGPDALAPFPEYPTSTFDPERDWTPGTERVPSEATAHLPEAAAPSTAKVGEAFGYDACFGDEGRFRVPREARLIADLQYAGYPRAGPVSVLAVDDVDAALAELEAHFGVPGDHDRPVRGERKLQSGETVKTLSRGISAGGGVCSALSSPDGKYLEIAYYND